MARAKKQDPRKLKEELARALAKQDWDDALELCEAILELEPKDERTLLKLAEMNHKTGRKTAALAAYNRLADFYADDGRLPRAISITKIILDLDPEDEAVHKKLALLYAKRGLPPAAAEKTAAEDVRQVTGRMPVRKLPPLPAAAPPPAPEIAPPPPARRQLAAAELAQPTVAELDLAMVEMAEEVPELPPTPLFSDLAPEELHAVLRGLEVRKLQPGEEIVRQGEAGNSVFVVADGEVRVRVRRASGDEIEVATLGEGAFFGEFGMFMDGRRHATVVAGGAVEVLELRHDDLMAVAVKHPRVKEVLASFYRKRALDTALAVSRLFGHMAPEARKELAALCVEERHPAETMVLQEGQEGQGLFLVKRGRLAVETRSAAGDTVTLAELGSGDFFGEISLLSGSPVTADVVTLEPAELLKFPKANVLEICGRYPEVRRALEETRERRIHESIERLIGVV